jgi:hypothetical protein
MPGHTLAKNAISQGSNMSVKPTKGKDNTNKSNFPTCYYWVR